MRKKIISCLLALAMVFSVLQGRGVPVKADPGAAEDNTIKVNASCVGMDITDTAVSQRIVKTLDAMIEAESGKVIPGNDENMYLIGIEEDPTPDLYDFEVCFDEVNTICTVNLSQTAKINTFEATLDCSDAEVEDIYSAITFCAYVGVVFSTEFEDIEDAYFSKGIDGTEYNSEADYLPNMRGDFPYLIPWGGTLSDIIAPELYAGIYADEIESEFVCFPEVIWEKKRYYS